MDIIAALNANSGSITAIATILLAVITAYYAWKVHDQTEFMREQSDVVRNIMKRDQLTRKYERLNKEMDRVIRPLNARKDDLDYFNMLPFPRNAKYHPNRYDNFYQFWDNIKLNMDLITSPTLRQYTKEYLNNLREYTAIEAKRPGITETKAAEVALQKSNHCRNLHESLKNQLIAEIPRHHSQLDAEIKQLESELESLH